MKRGTKPLGLGYADTDPDVGSEQRETDELPLPVSAATDAGHPPPAPNGTHHGNGGGNGGGNGYDDEPTTSELRRALYYVENRVDRALREIFGEGRDPGVRGEVSALRTEVGYVRSDVQEQRAEQSAAAESTRREMEAQRRELSAQIKGVGDTVNAVAARKLHPLVVASLVAILALATLAWVAIAACVVWAAIKQG